MNITFSRISTAQRALGGHERLAAPRDANAKLGVKPNSLATAKPSGSLASLVGLGRTLPRQDEGASFSLPSGSLIDPGSSPFERGDFIQTVRDCVPVIGAFLFLTVTAIAVAASTFMMFFVSF